MNLTALVLARARERGAAPCVLHVDGGEVHSLSWADLAAQVATLMVRLDALALPHGAAIGVLARNRQEWIVVDLAASGRGLVTVSLDPGWSDNMLVRVLVHAAVAGVVVETTAELARLRALSPRLPLLRSLVVIDAGADTDATRLATLLADWRDPQTRPAAAVAALLDRVTADDPATVIFTSGSTGEPKGVLRTHGNTLSRGWALFPWMGDADAPDPAPDDVLLDPLSFCHSAGRWWYQTALARGVVLALPDPRGLTLADLALLAPTHIAAVPRVVLALREQLAPHVHALVAHIESLPAGDPELAALGARLGSQIRERLGGRVRCIVAGGAPLATSLIDFFATAGVAVLAGYGGTEPGIIAVGSHAPRGTVGRPTGAEVRIVDGEVVVRGPAVTPGYLANPAATARALDERGWWHTGDRGALDDAGHLRITGRLHALFNCHDGTNIDPSEIEQLLEADPYIRAAVIVGHRRPFIAALIVADDAMFVDATPDERARVLAGRIERLNHRLEPFEQVLRLRVVDGARLAGLRRVTATQKLQIDRDAVELAFAGEIAAMYEPG